MDWDYIKRYYPLTYNKILKLVKSHNKIYWFNKKSLNSTLHDFLADYGIIITFPNLRNLDTTNNTEIIYRDGKKEIITLQNLNVKNVYFKAIRDLENYLKEK